MQVDWKKVEKDVNKAKKRLKKKANKAAPEINTLIEEVKVPVKKFALFSSLFSIIHTHMNVQNGFFVCKPTVPSTA